MARLVKPFLCVFVWSLTLLTFASGNATAAEPRRVLLLHSFGHAFSPWSDMAASFRAELVRKSAEPIDLYEVSLDTARFQDPRDERPFVEYLQALLSGRKLDLMVPMGMPAANFILRHRAELFASTPMLIAGADQRRVSVTTLGANDAAVANALDIPAYIENVLRLRPQTKNIAAILGKSPIEQFWLTELRSAAEAFASRVTFTWFDDLPFEEMLKRAADLPPDSAIFYALLAEDAKGVPYSQDRALDALRAVSSAPIFGIGDYQLGRGIVGGPLLQSHGHGRQTGEVALRILAGERPNDIRLPPLGLSMPVYDWRELRRWDIGASRLPPGSVVQFREPTVWEQYRWQIMAIIAALLAQALLIAGLLYQRSRRRQAEAEARRRMAELAYMSRHALAGEMSASIAHEINQPLTAIVLSGNVGLRWLTHATPNLEEASAAFRRIVSDGHRASQVIATIRAMFKKETSTRAPVEVNDVIREVLRLLRLEFEERQVSVRRVLTEGLPEVTADRIQLVQVVLNLVRNANDAMASIGDRPRILRIRSEADESGDVLITIEDSGTGIDPEKLERIFEPFFTTKPQGMGIGLSICRSIIEDHGGRLSVRAAKPYGSVFEIVLPVPGEAA